MISPARLSAAILLGLVSLALGCASAAVERPASLITSEWKIDAPQGEAAPGILPENERARQPGAGADEVEDPAPTGWVKIGHREDADGLASARVYKHFECGRAGGSCTVWVRIAADKVGDDETLVATLSRAGSPGASETRTLAVLEGYTEVHEIAVKGCGKMRIELRIEEGGNASPGVQSQLRIKLDGFLCE